MDGTAVRCGMALPAGAAPVDPAPQDPTGTGVGDLGVRIGQDTNGRDGWWVNWRYPDEPLLAHLTVRATGPGGTAEKVVGIYHPDPAEQP
jgi:hypothetical protein